MCLPCHENALDEAPVIIEVPEGHDDYKSGNLIEFR